MRSEPRRQSREGRPARQVNVAVGSFFQSAANHSMTFNAAANSTIAFSPGWQQFDNLTMGVGSGNLTFNTNITNLNGILTMEGGQLIMSGTNYFQIVTSQVGKMTFFVEFQYISYCHYSKKSKNLLIL